MPLNNPKVDLSTGTYDDFETTLSNTLGIKVFMIKGWELPSAYYTADSDIQFAKTQEALDAARANFKKTEEIILGSLRANIAARDPELGTSLTDNELRSLIEVKHVTKRGGNAEPEEAVIIFDPHPAAPAVAPVIPAMPAVQNPGDEKTVRIIMTPAPASSSISDEDYVLSNVFTTRFTNGWDRDEKEHFLPLKPLVESLDIDAEDLRRYRAIQRVKYALENQSEYNNLGRQWYYQPEFYHLADIGDKDYGQMDKAQYDMSYHDVHNKLRIDSWIERKPQEWGIKDPQFFEKMKMASAVMALVYSNLTPNEALVRIDKYSDLDWKQVEEIKKNINEGVEKQIASHLPGSGRDPMFEAMLIDDDLRIKFPAFREMYEQDKSTGRQRELYDTIMKGLQKWFPSMTNAPVSIRLNGDPEPPRSTPKASPKAAHKSAAKRAPKHKPNV